MEEMITEIVTSKKPNKAQQRATNKYVKNHYDRLAITVPKGRREEIKKAADSLGLSANALVNEAIDNYLKTI